MLIDDPEIINNCFKAGYFPEGHYLVEPIKIPEGTILSISDVRALDQEAERLKE